MAIAVLRSIFDLIKSPLFVFSSNLLSHMRRSLATSANQLFSSFPLLQGDLFNWPSQFSPSRRKATSQSPKSLSSLKVKKLNGPAFQLGWNSFSFVEGDNPAEVDSTISWHPQIFVAFFQIFCNCRPPKNCPLGKFSLYPNLLTRQCMYFHFLATADSLQ